MNKMDALNPNDPDQCAMEMDRAKAMDRAFLMSKLFRKEYFYKIVDVINRDSKDESRGPMFISICVKDAGLTEAQAVWLWNYLQNYRMKLAWNSPVGVTNGW